MPTLAQLRERALLSQSELAKLCEVDAHTVYYWESGRSTPRPKQRRMLVQALGCTPDELLAALKETQEVRKEREKLETAENKRPAA